MKVAGQFQSVEAEMGQSRDTMAGLLNRMQGMPESSCILSDEIFKTLFQYKYVVAKVLKAVPNDFAAYSLDELIKGICDVSARHYASDKELYTSKIDVLNLEDKPPGEKEIKYDLVFQISLPDKKRSGKTAMNREVKEMISMEEFQRLARQEGIEEGRQDGLVEAIRSCYQGLLASQKNDDEAIKMTASLLRQKESDVRKIIREQLAI